MFVASGSGEVSDGFVDDDLGKPIGVGVGNVFAWGRWIVAAGVADGHQVLGVVGVGEEAVQADGFTTLGAWVVGLAPGAGYLEVGAAVFFEVVFDAAQTTVRQDGGSPVNGGGRRIVGVRCRRLR